MAFSSKLLEDVDQKVTADGGVLVDEELHTLERFALEEIKEALDICRFGFGCSGQKVGLHVAKDALAIEEGFRIGLRKELFASDFDPVVDGFFILLQELSFGGVELVAVAVERGCGCP